MESANKQTKKCNEYNPNWWKRRKKLNKSNINSNNMNTYIYSVSIIFFLFFSKRRCTWELSCRIRWIKYTIAAIQIITINLSIYNSYPQQAATCIFVSIWKNNEYIYAYCSYAKLQLFLKSLFVSFLL